MSVVSGSGSQALAQKLSERWSAQGFAAGASIANGVTSAAAAVNAAIVAASGSGGHEIYLPAGIYAFPSRLYVAAAHAGVTLVGDGEATIIKRTANITDGQGLLDIYGKGITFRNLTFEGDVTTSVGYVYGTGGGSDFDNNPMHANLVRNSSVWIHSGARRIHFEKCYFNHTGGYAGLIDADNDDVIDILYDRCVFRNCRPHLFGESSGDRNYGAWTGGLLYRGDCRTSTSKPYAVKGLRVVNCLFERMNGNCIWGHSYGFDVHHEDVVIQGNVFRYIARDAYLAGNVRGGGCYGNSAFYVGFKHTTDSDTPVLPPTFLANHYAVGFDASGYVREHNFVGNVVNEFYGGGMDLDGLRDSVVSGNSMASSQSVAKGIQTGDTSANGGGHNLSISNNRIKGCNAGAIVLNQADGVICSGNVIDHPSGAAAAPIVLYSLNKNTKNTIVTGNDVSWPDASYVIQENDAGTGTGFDGTTSNSIYGNHYRGGAIGEYKQDPNSASRTSIRLSSNSPSITDKQESELQREGTGATAALKIYDTQGATRKQFAQLQLSNGLFNVSENGAVQTGIFTTGARTSLGFKDAIWTGKLMGDGFLAMYDYAGAVTSFQASDANALSNDWALLRFNKTAGYWEQSVSTSAGARVWAQLTGVGGSGISGLTAGRVTFAASATSITDDGALLWDNTNKRLGLGTSPSTRLHVSGVSTFTGTGGSAAIDVTAGFIDSDGGFYTGSSNTDAIQAPAGGVTALYLIGTESATLLNSSAGVSASGQVRLRANANKLQVSENGGAYVDILGGGASQWTTSGSSIYYNGTGVWIGATSDDSSGAKLQVTGFVRATTGFATPSTATDSIQSPSGGVTARFLIGTRSLTLTGDSAANAGLSASGQGRIYFDSTANRFKVSEHGAAYVNLTEKITSINSLAGPAITISRGTGIGGTDSGSTVSITNTGVTSLSAGTGISLSGSTGSVTITNTGVISLSGTTNQVNVSASTGSITLSLPQSIHTSANVSFGTVSSAGAVQSSSSGTSIAFQTANFNFQVNGNGVVSSAGGINVGGLNVIDSSRNLVNIGTITSSGLLNVSNGNINIGTSYTYSVGGSYFGQDATGGLVCGSRTLYFKSGLLYAWA